MFSIVILKKVLRFLYELSPVNKVILLVVLFISLSGIAMGIMQYKESERIREYKDVKIEKNVYINNEKFNPSKSYKERNEILFVPLDDVIEALGEKVDYEEKSFGKIVLNYQDKLYNMKKGSNEIYESKEKETIKMDGRVELMYGRLYVPVEFVLEEMPVNIIEASGNRLYIDSFKEIFDYSWTENNKYIAHAMGGIDRRDYTNSKEAFERNYENGYRVFEADIAMTSDGVPVLLHAWGGAEKMGLPSAWNGEDVRYSDFKNQKIYGMYTTMSFRDACKEIKDKKDTYLILDIKTTPSEASEFYSEIVKISKDVGVIDRIIPQIYEREMYNVVMGLYDFKSMVYSLYKDENISDKEVVDFTYENGVKVVVINRQRYDKEFIKELSEKGIKVYMNTYNDPYSVSELEKVGVTGFFSDFINPKTEKNPYLEQEKEEKENAE